jgi:hypothetical protein
MLSEVRQKGTFVTDGANPEKTLSQLDWRFLGTKRRLREARIG